jgi:hypothetical protein
MPEGPRYDGGEFVAVIQRTGITNDGVADSEK